MNPSKSLYLPGLNGIRAIAAMLVVLSHIDLRIDELGFVQKGGISMAGHGVTMFFVLSGYLITTLLLKEQDKTGAIALRKFYIRRILRIWPIYYLALLIGVLLLIVNNQSVDKSGLFFYVFFMSNVPYVFGGVIRSVVQLWSVGVEEQFYLFWPWLFRWRKKLPYIMVAIIIFFLGLRMILRVVENGNWYTFIGVTRFHCMAVGGLGAWAVHYQKEIIKKLYYPILQVFCWSVLLVSVYRPLHIFSIIDAELYAILFLIIIINVSTNPKTILRLEHPVISWLGRISYGIYVYHFFAIGIGFSLLKGWLPVSAGFEIVPYLVVTAITIAIAHFSFYFFETWFLRKKDNYAVVHSSTISQELPKVEQGLQSEKLDRVVK